MIFGNGGLEPRQVRHQTHLAIEVLEDQRAVLLDQGARLVDVAPQLPLRLCGDRRRGVVRRRRNRHQRQQRHGGKQTVGER